MHRFVSAVDTPSYSLNDVAAAAGITTAKVKRMLTDGVISLGVYDQKATKGVPRRFTLRRALSIALDAKALAWKMDSTVRVVIARTFADGDARNRPLLESPSPLFIMLFPETHEFKFLGSANITLKEMQTPFRPPNRAFHCPELHTYDKARQRAPRAMCGNEGIQP
jgi:hypothetical protein